MPTKRDNQETIKKEAKKILEKFAKALAGVNRMETKVSLTSHPSFNYVERDEDRRIEGDGKVGDSEFRKIFFENAPDVEKDCIKAEKGGWK